MRLSQRTASVCETWEIIHMLQLPSSCIQLTAAHITTLYTGQGIRKVFVCSVMSNELPCRSRKNCEVWRSSEDEFKELGSLSSMRSMMARVTTSSNCGITNIPLAKIVY